MDRSFRPQGTPEPSAEASLGPEPCNPLEAHATSAQPARSWASSGMKLGARVVPQSLVRPRGRREWCAPMALRSGHGGRPGGRPSTGSLPTS